MLMPPEPIGARRHVPHEQAGESHVVNAKAAIRRVPTSVLVAVVPVVTVIAVLVTSLVSEDHAATSASPTAPDTVVIKNFTFSPKPLTGERRLHDHDRQRRQHHTHAHCRQRVRST